MSHWGKNKADDKCAAAEGKDGLGISRSIYATGNSAKDGFIGFILITGTLIGAIAFGKSRGHDVIKMIEENSRNTQGLWKESRVGKYLEPYIAKIKRWLNGPTIALSAGIGYVASHFVMIPSAAVGWKKAQRAVDKYNNLSDEKERLVNANAELIAENQEYKAALEKNSKPFTERVRAEPGVAAGAAR
jgi:hypothetical protein